MGTNVSVEHNAFIFRAEVGHVGGFQCYGGTYCPHLQRQSWRQFVPPKRYTNLHVGPEDGCSMFHRNISTTMSTRRHNPEDYNRQNTYVLCDLFYKCIEKQTRQKRAMRQVDAALVHACMRAGGQKSLIRAVSQSGDVGRATSEIV